MRVWWDLPLSWLILPGVLCYTWFFGMIQFIVNILGHRDEEYWGSSYRTPRDYRDVMFDLLTHAPILKDGDLNTYVPGLKFNERPNGKNHCTDTQVEDAALYVVAYSKILGSPQMGMIDSLNKNIHSGQLRRGFILKDGNPYYSDKPVSGDQLVGYCFAFVHHFKHGIMAPKMAYLSQQLIKHQGLMIQGGVSPLANYLPMFKFVDIEPSLVVGKHHLQYLAGVLAGLQASKTFDSFHRKKYGIKSPWYFRFHYWKRLYLYGTFLSVMFPTTAVEDRATMEAAYICHRLTKNPVFLVGALWTWALGYPDLNGFHAGLIYEMTGGRFPSVIYMQRCMKRACHGAHESVVACLADITWSILR